MKIHTTKPFGIIISALTKYREFLAPTYGPVGKKILMGTGFSPYAVDEGSKAAEDFELEDELENGVIKLNEDIMLKLKT